MAINCPIGVNPLDQSTGNNAPKLNSFTYTHQDFESMKTRLIKFIIERFPKDFNDFIESSLAIMEMEIFAFIADSLSFKIDQIANEMYINTVTEKENAFRLANLVSFQPLPPLPATALFSATINSLQSVDVIIPAGVVVSVFINNEQITYELYQADANNNPLFEEDIIISAGSFSNTSLIGIQGKTLSNVFNGTGEVNQTFELESFPVFFDSIKVSVDGSYWTKVDFFTDSQPRKEFRVEFDSNYRAYVVFGNNRSGIIPSQGSKITVSYRIGNGTLGNAITGSIEFQRQFDVQDLGFSVNVSFINYTAATGGYDGDTLEDVKNKLPNYIKSQNRAVTAEDYKNISELFATAYHGQVGKSNVVLRNYGCAGNVIDIYVLARDGENGLMLANNELKSALQQEVESKKMITDYVCIRDGVILYVDVMVDVTVDKYFRKNKEEMDIQIKRKINEFFSLTNWQFGMNLKESDLIKMLSSIKEIKTLDLTFLTTDPNNSGNSVVSKFYEIIRYDSISVNYIFE